MSYVLLTLTLLVEICCIALVGCLAGSCLRSMIRRTPSYGRADAIGGAAQAGAFALRAADRWTALDDLQVARLLRDPKT